MDKVELSFGKVSYKLYGNEAGPAVVIMTAMGSTSAEWWHLAQKWSDKFRVLVYDRAGYGESGKPKQPRSPINICKELNELLIKLEIKEIILVGHSIGGLFAYQYAKLYLGQVKKLVLVDPVSSENRRFNTELTKSEFKASGADKIANLKLGYALCSLGLGWILKPLLKKAPPFYYYKEFSKEAESYIMNNQTHKTMYKTALGEYSYINNNDELSKLKIERGSLTLTLYLICHTPEVMMKEIEYYGNTDEKTAGKVEMIWQEIMKVYLELSTDFHYIQAKSSGHFIHLTDPESIRLAIQQSI